MNVVYDMRLFVESTVYATAVVQIDRLLFIRRKSMLPSEPITRIVYIALFSQPSALEWTWRQVMSEQTVGRSIDRSIRSRLLSGEGLWCLAKE